MQPTKSKSQFVTAIAHGQHFGSLTFQVFLLALFSKPGGGVGVGWGGKGRGWGGKGRGGGVVRGGGAWWSQCIGRYRPTLFVGAWLVYLPIGIYFREKDSVAAMGSIVAAMSVTAFFIPFPKNQFFLLIQQ